MSTADADELPVDPDKEKLAEPLDPADMGTDFHAIPCAFLRD